MTSQYQVLATVTFYMVAAIVMVTVNKWVLVHTDIPITFVALQLALAGVLLESIRRFGFIEMSKFQVSTAKQLGPVILANTASIVLSNLCLQYVDSSFYQVARGLVLPITVAFAVFDAQPPSRRAIMCCGIMTLGFFIGCSGIGFGGGRGEKGVTLAGVCFGLGGSVVTAYHSILIKRSLKLVDGSAIVLAYYSNIGSALLLLPVILLFGEAKGISQLLNGNESLWVFTYGTIITGVVGFLMCIAGLLSVKVTSPVTHMVSSALRGVLQTFIGIWVFSEAITQRRALSIFAILAGSCAYVWVKHDESRTAEAVRQEAPRRPELSEKV